MTTDLKTLIGEQLHPGLFQIAEEQELLEGYTEWSEAVEAGLEDYEVEERKPDLTRIYKMIAQSQSLRYREHLHKGDLDKARFCLAVSSFAYHRFNTRIQMGL